MTNGGGGGVIPTQPWTNRRQRGVIFIMASMCYAYRTGPDTYVTDMVLNSAKDISSAHIRDHSWALRWELASLSFC